jgi:predicted ATPase
MDGKRLLHSLRLENFLSYGPEGVQLELEPLNILIGQNASGKSNIIQAIELLRAAPSNITIPIIQGGGVEEWLYKGEAQMPTAGIAASVDYPVTDDQLHHLASFTAINQRFRIVDEAIESATGGKRHDIPGIYYSYQRGEPAVATRVNVVRGNENFPTLQWAERPISGIKPDLSILSQRNDPEVYPPLNYLAEQYQSIKIYRGFNFDGPNSMRRAQQPDLPTDFLEEDGRNLSLVLNDLQYRGGLDIIVEKLKAVYEDVESINVRVAGGTVQTFLRERGMSSPIPAARLSDGTLRYLCLLTILYHPTPPPLICLEEPEIGLHPDLISGLAEMLKEASQRTQIIVTTHSDLLVSKFSDQPEAVVVCERTPTGTTLKRLEAKALETWLEEYSLGEVWMRGGIGGTRW